MSDERGRKAYCYLEEEQVGLGIGMGIRLARKGLFIMTGGLSGRVFKEDSKQGRTAKATERRMGPPERQPKATPVKARATRRSKPRAARKPVAQTAASSNGTAKELERLATLHGEGALTNEEFAAGKAKILGTSLSPTASGTEPAKFPAVEANVAAARNLADLADHHPSPSIPALSSD